MFAAATGRRQAVQDRSQNGDSTLCPEMTDLRQAAWDQSYARLENHLFWPHEEVVRFVSRYVRRRVGPAEFVDVLPGLAERPRLLDLGCGLGRHVAFADEIGLEGYGIDLSEVAIKRGRAWLGTDRLVAGDARALPWEDAFFSVAVSHGVLDSMPFTVARDAVAEVHRVLGPGGLFYADLVAGGDAEEVVVAEGHEAGTVQSYFDEARLGDLFADRFTTLDRVLVTHERPTSRSSRWHVVLRREDG
jgi:SAM-dependent methyltransferase